VRAALAAVSLGLGAVYVAFGAIIAADLLRAQRAGTVSHFGRALLTIAWTCGPHHLEHGIHLAAGRAPGPVELATVVAGLPTGVVWLYLRLEAMAGGRGDRRIAGTPWWLRAGPPALAAYSAGVAAALGPLLSSGGPRPELAANLWLVGLYGLIAWYLLRGQLVHRRATGGWSLSGLTLTGIFASCAYMHLAWLAYAASGTYELDPHGLVIDWLGVPAAVYFCWVVREMSLGGASRWAGVSRT
jgi:hypothetical protein